MEPGRVFGSAIHRDRALSLYIELEQSAGVGLRPAFAGWVDCKCRRVVDEARAEIKRAAGEIQPFMFFNCLRCSLPSERTLCFAKYGLLRLGKGEDLTRIVRGGSPRRLASKEEVLALKPELLTP